MTPEAQRIAIAEACGWIRFWQQTGDEEHIGHWLWHRGGVNTKIIPDYLNDLNAMHKAEKILSPMLFAQDADGQRTEVNLYLTWLTRICGHTPIAFATAAQRAEAFLRTIGKWEEPK